jgi:hypothetical protein
MAFWKMNRVAEADNVTQKIGPMTEAFQNARHLLTAGLLPPLIVNRRNFSRRVGVFNQFDFGFAVSHIARCLRNIWQYTMRRLPPDRTFG